MRMVNHIIESDMAINLSKEELISIFGNGRDEAHWHLVSYDIPTPFFSIYKKKLNFYFNDKRVDRVVLKFRRKVLTKKGKWSPVAAFCLLALSELHDKGKNVKDLNLPQLYVK